MRLKRRVRITFRSESVVALLGGGARPAAWCPGCSAVVAMLTPDEAAAVACVSTRRVFRWLESDSLHFVEAAGPSPLVCLRSVAALAARGGDGGDDAAGDFSRQGGK